MQLLYLAEAPFKQNLCENIVNLLYILHFSLIFGQLIYFPYGLLGLLLLYETTFDLMYTIRSSILFWLSRMVSRLCLIGECFWLLGDFIGLFLLEGDFLGLVA